MSLLIKHSSLGLQVWDIKSLVNVRSFVPDFHKLARDRSTSKSRMHSRALYEYDASAKMFHKHDDGYNPVNPTGAFRLMEHIIINNNIKPMQGDKIELRIQRRMFQGFQDDTVQTYLDVQSDILSFTSIHMENIVSNVYQFSNSVEESKRDLSHGFMISIDGNNCNKFKPSVPILQSDFEDGIEDTLVISYYKIRSK
jgi:hypothetical protein